MIYEVIAEAHEGVWSCPEETLGKLEAENPAEALAAYAATDNLVTWVPSWNKWVLRGARKIFAREIKG